MQSISEQEAGEDVNAREKEGNIVDLGFIGTLEPDSLVSLPIWLRGAELGSAAFRFLFYYEPFVSYIQAMTLLLFMS